MAQAPTAMSYIQKTIILVRFWPSLGSEIVTENCGGPQIHYETSAKRRLRTADKSLVLFSVFLIPLVCTPQPRVENVPPLMKSSQDVPTFANFLPSVMDFRRLRRPMLQMFCLVSWIADAWVNYCFANYRPGVMDVRRLSRTTFAKFHPGDMKFRAQSTNL